MSNKKMPRSGELHGGDNGSRKNVGCDKGIIPSTSPQSNLESPHIFRIVKNRNFTIVPNDIMNDERLSAEALGVLSYVLSRADNRTTCDEEFRKRFDLERGELDRILSELEKWGYIRRLPPKATSKGVQDVS